jgi:hypothetical protein
VCIGAKKGGRFIMAATRFCHIRSLGVMGASKSGAVFWRLFDMRTFTRDVSLRALAVSLLALLPAVGLVSPASAARLENKVAVFSGIDKITGRITSFDVYINETVQFGALQVTPKVCYSRDDTEAQKIDSFVEVDEITLDRKIRRIFTGWMFADSPGLNAVEHPIYDVWLTGCKQDSDVPPPSTASK